MKIDVSIIIVNYNTKELLADCIDSIYKNTLKNSFEIIVCDNGSSDGSIEMIKRKYPLVKLIENKENLGFGTANNKGLNEALGKYVFYLNSDTILLNDAISYFFDFWEDNCNALNIGALGCFLKSRQGNIIHSYDDFPTLEFAKKTLNRVIFSALFGQFAPFVRKFIKYKDPLLRIEENSIEISGYITGADLFMLNNEDAKFDEDFFMYFEETDLQLNKLQKKGKKRIIIQGPQIIHLEGGSDTLKHQKYSFRKKTAGFYWISCCRFFSKNYKNRETLLFMRRVLMVFLIFGVSSDVRTSLRNLYNKTKTEI